MFKVTMVFQQATVVSDPLAPARRIAGWTESHYDNDAIEKVKTDLNRLCEERAKMLPKGATIIGQRIQQVTPTPGAVQTKRVTYPGNPTFAADIPQMALLCSVQGTGVRNTRNVTLRGIPDELVVEGELKPSDAFDRAFRGFSNWLGGYYFRGTDLTLEAKPFLGISTLGVMDLEENTTLNPGDMVKILRAINSNGDQVGGRFQVDSTTNMRQMTLKNWTHGACKGGKYRKDAGDFFHIPVSGLTYSSITTRRVGRPSSQYRGRQRKRA